MKIGNFRRQTTKTLNTKGTKSALKAVSKNTIRTQTAQATVALKCHTGALLQSMGQYLLGAQQTQEMKDAAFRDLGDIACDLTILGRVLKVKLPSSNKKSKLVGTRGAALLQLDGLATDLLRQAEKNLFAPPTTKTVKKMVTMPNKGGVKEEREVSVVDVEAEQAADNTRTTEMRSFLNGAVDVFWRLSYDITGKVPEAVIDAKYARMQQAFPHAAFDADKPKVKGKPPVKGFKKKVKEEAVPA